MQTFRCQCGARVFFENTLCLACGSELGFLPDTGQLQAVTDGGNGRVRTGDQEYRKCANYVAEGICNWLIPGESKEELCQACRLNNVIPNLSDPENRRKWAEVESAKRRLVYSLNQLGLPLVPKTEDPDAGLAFDIKQETGGNRVLTGHAEGLITLNLSEADAATREQTRVSLNERYRTLLGHFRHEIGHYYWERLVRDTAELAKFRKLFGDERADYAASLKEHYGAEARSDFSDSYISAYASAHPWEDFAETFAHYLHMIDTLETARQFGFAESPDADGPRDLDGKLAEFTELTIALNALNRSMGLPDAYPFAVSPRVKQKLEFVHALIRKAPAVKAATNTERGAAA